MLKRISSGYVWLYVAKLAALGANLIIYKYVGERLGVNGFGEYSLARRALAVLLPILILGQLVALPRLIAIRGGGGESSRQALVAATAVFLSAMGIVVGISTVAPGALADLFFGSPEYRILLAPMMSLVLAQGVFFLVSGYLQGRMNFRMYGVVGLICGGIAPLCGFWLAPRTTIGVLYGLAISVGFSAVVLGVVVVRRLGRHAFQSLPFRELLVVGLPRVPGDFAMGGMLGIPSMLVASRVGIAEAGAVAFCGTMMSMAITAVAPISTAWLPKFTDLARDGHGYRMKKTALTTLAGVLAVITVGLGVVGVLMPLLTKWYLGEDFLPSVSVFRIFSAGLIPITIYGCLRSIVDSAYAHPVNTYNIGISLATFFLCEHLFRSILSGVWPVIAGALVSYVVLALLTVLVCIRPFRPGFRLVQKPES